MVEKLMAGCLGANGPRPGAIVKKAQNSYEKKILTY